MTYELKNDLDQNLDQNSHTSDQKMEKKEETSTIEKATVRFSEPIAEYRLISSDSSSSDKYSKGEYVSWMEDNSFPINGMKKRFLKFVIYLCMFIFIVVIVLCGFFSDHSVVQHVILPVGVFILFCIVFYRAIMGSSYSVSGFSQREEGGYENDIESLEENLLDENDIKSSI